MTTETLLDQAANLPETAATNTVPQTSAPTLPAATAQATKSPAKWTATAPPANKVQAKPSAPTTQALLPAYTEFETFDPPEKPDTELTQILSFRRRHGSLGVQVFKDVLYKKLEKVPFLQLSERNGNIVAVTDPASKILFSCHIDTVHSQSESMENKPQALAYDSNFGHLFLDGTKGSAGCLGADDGAGVYLLLQMIRAKVPGTYIFHEGEECGGIGSKALLTAHREWLKKFTHAFAFDRAGTTDIVITQGGEACASPALATELALRFKNAGVGGLKECHKGSFTDTKVYRYTIPECVNISVGYENAHQPSERLDVAYLEALVAACKKLDWASLPVVRKPEPEPVYSPGPGYGYFNGHSAGRSDHLASHFGSASIAGAQPMAGFPKPKAKGKDKDKVQKPKARIPANHATVLELLEDMPTWSRNDFDMLVMTEPEVATSLMLTMAARIKGLSAELTYLQEVM